ncbi:hypothetical protein Tco_0994641 [Tanacetum coccineum]
MTRLSSQGKNKDLERSCTSRKSVASVRNRILEYPDSDEEDEEYSSLPPLLLCFQTPQPCATLKPVHHNNHNEVDIESITLEEYARYELAMSTMKNEIQVPTQAFTSQFFNQPQYISKLPLDEEDSSFDKILDDLFKLGAENIRKMEHEVPNRCDNIIDYEDSDQEDGGLLAFLPSLLLMNLLVFVNRHSNTKEAIQWSPTQDPFLVILEPDVQSSFLLRTIPSSISNKLLLGNKIRGLHDSFYVVKWLLEYNKLQRRHSKFGLVRYHAEDDDGIFVIMDVARRSRLGAWLRALGTLYKLSGGNGSRIIT